MLSISNIQIAKCKVCLLQCVVHVLFYLFMLMAYRSMDQMSQIRCLMRLYADLDDRPGVAAASPDPELSERAGAAAGASADDGEEQQASQAVSYA